LLQQFERVGAADERDDQDENQHADATPADHAGATHPAAVLNVGAAST
jgi:hypothetical protein